MTRRRPGERRATRPEWNRRWVVSWRGNSVSGGGVAANGHLVCRHGHRLSVALGLGQVGSIRAMPGEKHRVEALAGEHVDAAQIAGGRADEFQNPGTEVNRAACCPKEPGADTTSMFSMSHLPHAAW